jgi:hypothetical protein
VRAADALSTPRRVAETPFSSAAHQRLSVLSCRVLLPRGPLASNPSGEVTPACEGTWFHAFSAIKATAAWCRIAAV